MLVSRYKIDINTVRILRASRGSNLIDGNARDLPYDIVYLESSQEEHLRAVRPSPGALQSFLSTR